jgi:diadenosine tetraphosphate (Ap4A) HIT family hydrolase
MILSPRRHAEALDELTDSEAAALGPLLVATTGALSAVVGCRKTYVMLFAERQGWAHIHFHVVPRMPDLEAELLGPGVLDLLRRPEREWVPPSERARLAEEIGTHVHKTLPALTNPP